jgi:hypothetical protein
LENHVHRTPRLGNHGLLNLRIGISRLPARRFDGSDVDLRCQHAMRTLV